MTKNIPTRDWEAISAYIDNELSSRDRDRFEARLRAEPELRLLVDEFKKTRTLVRSLEPVRAPRNFTLTPEMAGQKNARYLPLQALQWASGFATLLFVLILAGDLLGLFGGQPVNVTTARFETIQATAQLQAPAAALEGEAAGGLTEPDESLSLQTTEEEIPAEEKGFLLAPSSTEIPPEAAEGAYPAPLPTETEGARVAADLATPSLIATEPADGLLQAAATSESVAPPVRSSLFVRYLEVALAVFALLSGMIAFVVRRSALTP